MHYVLGILWHITNMIILLISNRPNFKKIWYATFQAALLRPIILFFEGVFTTDETIPIPKVKSFDNDFLFAF